MHQGGKEPPARAKNGRNSGDIEGKAGNGTAMRAAPVGLWNHDNLDQLKKDSIAHSHITHKDARAKAGAAAVAFVIAYNLNHEKVDADELVKSVSEFVRDISEEFSNHLARMKEWLAKDEQIAVLEISCAGWLSRPAGLTASRPLSSPRC